MKQIFTLLLAALLALCPGTSHTTTAQPVTEPISDAVVSVSPTVPVEQEFL